MTGLVTVNANVNYSLLDSVFDLHQYAGLIGLKDNEPGPKSIMLRLPEVSGAEEIVEITANVSIDEPSFDDQK